MRVSQDLGGGEAGGGVPPAREVREVWRVAKSE